MIWLAIIPSIPPDAALFFSVICTLLLFFLLNHEIDRRREAEAEKRSLLSRTWGPVRMDAIRALPDRWNARNSIGQEARGAERRCAAELRKLLAEPPRLFSDRDPAARAAKADLGNERFGRSGFAGGAKRDRPPPG